MPPASRTTPRADHRLGGRPLFYILHGNDEFSRSEQVVAFKDKVGDATVRDFNVTVLDGRKVTLAEVRHAADAVPFLADKRLVIVEGLLARWSA